jgi:cholesterol oxidase
VAETALGLDQLVRENLQRINDRVVERIDDQGPWLGEFVRSFSGLSRDKLLETSEAALKELYPLVGALLDHRDLLDLLRRLARMLAAVDAPLENATVLLAMGPDQAWRLTAREQGIVLKPLRPNQRVEAEPLNRESRLLQHQLYRTQERLMRDFASRAGGELRTNPAWTLGERPVTVHAQGGCSMGEVTSPFGEVYEFSGLYVMDAAAFPASVGVNPSHTIAAVAERNVEQFIVRELGVAREPSDATTSPATREAVALADRILANVAPLLADATPLCLAWTERMTGFVSEGQELNDEAMLETYLAREQQDKAKQLSLSLQARVPDLDLLLGGDFEQRIKLDGTLTLADADGTVESFKCGGKLVLKVESDGRLLGMRYKLTSSMIPDFELIGYKRLEDDAGPDAWLDVTTLYVRLAHGGSYFAGVVRVSLRDFWQLQLNSFRIENSDVGRDREFWALARFGKFFFGGMARVYLPELF